MSRGTARSMDQRDDRARADAAPAAAPDGGRAAAPAAAAVPQPALIATLVFGSGACGLIYQTAWMRELRAIMGASTPATATVLALFMGGLGIGAWWLGPRADRERNALQFYGMLELMIAATAALSPMLMALVRAFYLGVGGAWTLGPVLGTVLRLVMAALVLGAPAFLMGGTLPAIVAAMRGGDEGRRRIALLYGINGAGAVLGVAFTTFLLLEHLGIRATIWIAALLNMGIGVTAVVLARTGVRGEHGLHLVAAREDQAPRAAHTPVDRDGPVPTSGAPVSATAVYVAAGIVGFVFFLMELVWYRMLTPLLGGTTYTFGLILGVAILGIGVGSLAHGSSGARRPPAPGLFALTCALEALALAIPFALGDRLAVTAILLRPLGQLSFYGHVGAWSLITAIVVLPAALVAGYQFPLLVRLLGRGGRDIGTHTGRAYAWNMGGAIAGSLAGGFGLLPWLSAPGAWRLCAVLLAALAVAALAVAPRAAGFRARLAAVVVTAVGAVLLVTLPAGPTPFWRHSPIGAGRFPITSIATPNDLIREGRDARFSTLWEADGQESSVAIQNSGGYALMVGGKSDGSAIGDAGTQVMLGMIGALLHPHPQKALVIGLGTGSTSGWLARVPSIERVDTIELEPAVMKMATLCATANLGVLDNPKSRILFGDGREFIQTTRERYDLIVSEPSNPYRAGVASLYTREFYRAAASRLARGGMLVQWLQVYEEDLETVASVFATMRAEFPWVEVWSTTENDVALVAALAPPDVDAETLRSRIAQEPVRVALRRAWGVLNLEGVAAHFVGDKDFVDEFAGLGSPVLNTDDRPVLEYRFARHVGDTDFSIDDLRAFALMRGHGFPRWSRLDILDGAGVALQRASLHVMNGTRPPMPSKDHPLHGRVAAMGAFAGGDHEGALRFWGTHDAAPEDLIELAVATELLVETGDARAPAMIERLRPERPIEADLLSAGWRIRHGDAAGAANAYVSACETLHRFPWAWRRQLGRLLDYAQPIAEASSPEDRKRMFDAVSQPFSEMVEDQHRLAIRLALGIALDGGHPAAYTREACDAYGASMPWYQWSLEARLASYQRLHDPREAVARGDLETFRRHEREASMAGALQAAAMR